MADMIVTGAYKVCDIARHVHAIGFEYTTEWITDRYGCRGVWRYATAAVAHTADIYPTEREAVAAAAQAFLDAIG